MTWNTAGRNGWFSVTMDEPEFAVRFDQRATILYQDFQQVLDISVQQLYQDWNDATLYLALSGGIDSELIAQALRRNKIPFVPVILKIAGINQREYCYAENWCEKHNIKPVILDITITEYCDAMAKFYKKLQNLKDFTQAQILILYEHVNQQGGYLIYGAADINQDQDRFYCCSLDFISDLVDVGHHPTSFFMYTPELALSYIWQFDMTKDEQDNKLRFYDLPPRPKIDYTVPLIDFPEVVQTLSKMIHISKYDYKKYLSRHWYGTRNQIIESLMPLV